MARDNERAERTTPPKVTRPPTPKHLRTSLPARLRNYFLAGVLITAPISITIWVAWNLLEWVDAWVTPLVPPKWNPETYLPFGVPGVGLIFIFIFLTIVGMLTAGFLGRVVMRVGERVVGQVPVVRSVYGATKQIFETVLSQQSTAFRQVAMVEYPTRGTWAIGFITGKTLGEVQGLTEETVFNVFIPATPNPTTGFLLFVPERDVHIVDMTVEQGLKLVVSGGIVTPTEEGPAAAARAKAAAQQQQQQEKRSRFARLISRWPRRLRNRWLRRLRNYFFAGMLVTAPISITLWLVWKFISFVDNRFTPLIPPKWNPETYLPYDLPGLGLIIALVGLTIVGMLTAGLTGRAVIRAGERVLNQVPVIRSLYSAIKQIIETILAKKSNAFREVVLFQYPRPEVWAIGFYTGESHETVQSVPETEVLNVFLPTTPNPTSGFLLFVPAKETRRLKMTVEEGLKMVVSGGIVTPDERPDRGESDGADRTREPREGLAVVSGSGSAPSVAEPPALPPRRAGESA